MSSDEQEMIEPAEAADAAPVEAETAVAAAAEPAAEAEPAVEREPVVEAEPAAEADPAAEAEPAVEREPVVEAEPAAEAEAMAEAEAAPEAEPAEPSEQAEDAEPAAEAEPATAAAETKPRVRKKAPRRPMRPGHRRRRPWHVDEVVARFAGCDRCSFFLAGYRSLQPPDALRTAVAEMESDWLILAWTPAVAELLGKSYGVRVDLDDYYVEGACPSCRRAFVYWAETEETWAELQASL